MAILRALVLSAAFALGSAGTSLSQQPGPRLHRAPTNPQFGGVFHPAYGLRTGQTHQARSGPDLLFNNSVLSNYYVLAGQLQEFVDEGILVDRNQDSIDQLNGMEFTYCSIDPSPNGVGSTVNFYDETLPCSGPSQWPLADCSYAIDGLPGGPNGNLACWTIALDFSGFECTLTTDSTAQRMFGWSMTWNHPATGPWLAQGGRGTLDQFEWFDLLVPNGNAAHLGCFAFGSHAPASFAVALFGNPVETLSISPIAPGRDDSLLLRVDRPVQAGNSIQFDVRDGPMGAHVRSTLWISRVRVENHLGSSFGIDAHELAQYSTRIRAATSFSPNGKHAFHVPNGVAPGAYYTQAAVATAGLPSAMSHALQHRVF